MGTLLDIKEIDKRCQVKRTLNSEIPKRLRKRNREDKI